MTAASALADAVAAPAESTRQPGAAPLDDDGPPRTAQTAASARIRAHRRTAGDVDARGDERRPHPDAPVGDDGTGCAVLTRGGRAMTAASALADAVAAPAGSTRQPGAAPLDDDGPARTAQTAASARIRAHRHTAGDVGARGDERRPHPDAPLGENGQRADARGAETLRSDGSAAESKGDQVSRTATSRDGLRLVRAASTPGPNARNPADAPEMSAGRPRLLPVPDTEPPFEPLPRDGEEALAGSARRRFAMWLMTGRGGDGGPPTVGQTADAPGRTFSVGPAPEPAAPARATLPGPRSTGESDNQRSAGRTRARTPDTVREQRPTTRIAYRRCAPAGHIVSLPLPIAEVPPPVESPVRAGAAGKRTGPDPTATASARAPRRADTAPKVHAVRAPATTPPRTTPRVRPAVIGHAAVPDWSTDDDVGVRLTATADLPPALDAATVLVRALAEVLSGRRSVEQLRIHCAPGVFAALARHPASGGVGPGPSTVWVCEPADGVAEVSAVCRGTERTRAIALRLEGIDGRWRITVLHLG